MENFNWVDYIFIGIFILSILTGFGRGLVKEVISLATLIAAFVVAIVFSSQLSVYFTSSAVVQNMVSQTSAAFGISTETAVSYAAIGISFGILFSATAIAGSIIGSIINSLFQVGLLGIGNRLLGGVFGFARGLLISLVIVFLVQLTPLAGESYWQQSKLVGKFQPGVVWLGSIVSPALDGIKNRFSGTIQDMGSTFDGVKGQVTNFIGQ